MAVIRNSANTIMRGRVGETTYYVNGGQQIARQAKNNSNYGDTARRSEAQQLRRIMWANLVNFYKVSATWMPKAFETKKRNQTDYNKFMQLNIGTARIALTKDEAAAGACVVDGFVVSQGSLPTIELTQQLTGYTTGISLGDLTIGSATTVGQLTAAILANNSNYREGMQLSFVNYTQSIDPLGIPRLVCRLYEVTLSNDSTELVRSYLPDFASTTIDGQLGCTNQAVDGAFTYIVSEIVAGALRVSTQQLTTKNQFNIITYSNQSQVDKAVASYGVDQEVILNPNISIQQQAPVQEIFVVSSNYELGGETVTVLPGESLSPASVLSNNPINLVLDGLDGQEYQSAEILFGTGNTRQASSGLLDGDVLTLRFSISSTTSSSVLSISVTFSDGQIATIRYR